MPFVIGQRWISESENNLGLGIITEIEARRVTIFFPAAETSRIYSIDNAPLNRVTFHIGDEITHRDGWQGDVVNVQPHHGLNIYLVKPHQGEETVVVMEKDIAHHITFSRPQDRLFNAQIDRLDHFVLRYHSFLHQQAQFQSPLRGLRGAKVGLVPHQLHIAQEVGQRIAPRVLLADEVGLGKTIEAGMILQQQVLAERVQRVLIIVPESLQHQWLVEMLRRFNLHFSLFDEERCQDFDEKGEGENNPFTSENFIICALDFLTKYPNRAKQALNAQFDLLIVDEAHHLQWALDNPSTEYQLVASLASVIPAVLLLTATPEQLGQESHFARLHLLDPERFHAFQAFLEEQQHYQGIANALAPLFTQEILTDKAQEQIIARLPEEKTQLAQQFCQLNTGEKTQENQDIRQEIIKKLIDRHGTSRVFFRNTRQGVQGFPKRHFHGITFPLPNPYQNAIKVMSALGQKDETQSPEQLFLSLNPDTQWWVFDPRFTYLQEFLQNNPTEKMLVICQHRQTAIHLEQALREKSGIYSALFHEEMSIVERDKASAYFADENGARVLISSRIGSEGRNFQFACHLVLFDLPEHPDLLEQCIGRLDRIGQKRDVHIHVPYFEQTPSAQLVEWYHHGLNAFEETCPMGETIFNVLREKRQYCLQHLDDEKAFRKLMTETQTLRAEMAERLEKGRDRLLEIHSNGGQKGEALAQAIADEDKNKALVNFALQLFDIVGVEQEDINDKIILLKPSSTMLIPDFPYLKEDGVLVTFDRDLASLRDEVEFLSWDHPMIRHGIDLVTTGSLGKTAVALLVNPNLPVGTLLLEMIFIVETQAPKSLQLTRFLPPTPIRLLVDMKGNELNKQVAFATLQSKLRPVKKAMANHLVKIMQSQIRQMIQQGETHITPLANNVIAHAKVQAENALNNEISRLQALQRVNKNIRPSEIHALENARTQMSEHLGQASWRLDSLRVIVTTKS